MNDWLSGVAGLTVQERIAWAVRYEWGGNVPERMSLAEGAGKAYLRRVYSEALATAELKVYRRLMGVSVDGRYSCFVSKDCVSDVGGALRCRCVMPEH